MNNLLTDSLKLILNKRQADSHKGMFGHALIIGGCENYVGAPIFSITATEQLISALSDTVMLSGAGTSSVLVPDFFKDSMYKNIRFSAIYSCKTENGIIKFDPGIMDTLMKKTTCCAIGMGMGEGESDKISEYILEKSISNLVVDADALRKCCRMDFMNRAVLTPHIGEFSVMTGISKEKILLEPEKYATEYALSHNCVIVLKSHNSIVTDGKQTYINHTGNAKLSKGGSGDILSGIICGLLAFSHMPFESAVVGSYILGKCAEITDVNEFSCLPTDIVRMIPAAFSSAISLLYNI